MNNSRYYNVHTTIHVYYNACTVYGGQSRLQCVRVGITRITPATAPRARATIERRSLTDTQCTAAIAAETLAVVQVYLQRTRRKMDTCSPYDRAPLCILFIYYNEDAHTGTCVSNLRGRHLTSGDMAV